MRRVDAKKNQVSSGEVCPWPGPEARAFRSGPLHPTSAEMDEVARGGPCKSRLSCLWPRAIIGSAALRRAADQPEEAKDRRVTKVITSHFCSAHQSSHTGTFAGPVDDLGKTRDLSHLPLLRPRLLQPRPWALQACDERGLSACPTLS